MAEQRSDLTSMTMEELLNIEVSVASNIVTEAQKQPVSFSAISKEQIENSGARTLNELLTIYVPGYFLVEDQDDTIAGFRGLIPDNNSKVLMLLNGINLNTEWFWGPPDAILNGLDLNFIERIEVIRGPGSVTLGQGALLGVINIVTKKGGTERANIRYESGADGLTKQTLSTHFKSENTSAFIYASIGKFDGTPMENQGWAQVRSEQGLTVFERNHHLKRSEYTNVLAHLEKNDLEINLFQFEHQRDLYNFYRDRESVEQRLRGISLSYKTELTDNLNLAISGKHLIDDYGLFSHGYNIETDARFNYEAFESGFSSITQSIPGLADRSVEPGLSMGGTRETRRGFKAILNWNNFFVEGNQAALGIEYNHYNSGQLDSRGNNFIINEEIQRLGLTSDGAGGFLATGSVNDNNAWAKPHSFSMKSVFFENVYSLNESTDWFAAFRWDSHPNWGSQITPRIGALFALDENQLFRVTFQTGFRGAVSVQYGGGFVQDGLLAESNFYAVNEIADTLADFDFDGDGTNDTRVIKSVEPEMLSSVEIAYSRNTSDYKFNAVLFHNTVEDILTAQAHQYDGLAFGDTIGTDDIGTWNGNWYYQNQEGELKQLGLELEIEYHLENWTLAASHASVKVTSADEGTIGVYVLPNKKHSAYPENVTRLHVSYSTSSSLGEWSFNLNDLWYWNYHSPTQVKVDGAHLVNLGASLNFNSLPNLTTRLTVKNLFDSDKLYPITGTGNLLGAEGTPSTENRSWWLSLNYSF
ncbi:TonB-dependent receptor plug domain-containing protein [Pleionea sediminis]|uniref:TonB-dependent receptor plug domain-containing protein n=1 Tax=Pleionea sediminis TaxID=2569479 RepID=UPI001185105E|nr:TonB-dependent receptor plug domain-containing protein [Pleionea sediminis]